MSKDILIAVPCWGAYHRKLFLGPVIKTHIAALQRLRDEFQDTIHVRYVVQTDAPTAVAKVLGNFELTLVPAASSVKDPMRTMAKAHSHAIETARKNERVFLLNADMLVSVEAFAAAERQFRLGKRAIVASATRTLPGLLDSLKPMKSRDLLAWTMKRAHPIIKTCFWGSGKCHLPWGVYFHENGSTVLRAFHLHPFAIMADRPLKFDGTVDLDLIDNYSRDEIHIVTDADEMALAEMSPSFKILGDNEWKIDTGQIVSWALRGARPMHWWNFSHRIAIVGDPNDVKLDIAIADEVLRLSPYAEALDAAA